MAHAFLWEYSYKRRLKLAQLLGQLRVFLTCSGRPGTTAVLASVMSASQMPPVIDAGEDAPQYWGRMVSHSWPNHLYSKIHSSEELNIGTST